MNPQMEIDGKHLFWCIFCGKYVEVVNGYHNCPNDKTTPKTYPGSL